MRATAPWSGPTSSGLALSASADKECEMPRADFIAFGRFVQALPRILTHGFQQAVAPSFRVRLDQRFLHQVAKHVERVGRFVIAPLGADASAASSVKPPGEDREARNSARSGSVEQVVAPVDQRAQRLLARQRGAVAAGQQAEAIVQARRDALDRQRAHARGGELERERNAVQPPADVGDRGARSASVTRKAGCAAAARSTNSRTASNCASAVDGDRLPMRRASRARAPGNVVSPAMRSGSRLDARIFRSRPACEQLPCELRAGLDQMLAVVEDEQQLAGRGRA